MVGKLENRYTVGDVASMSGVTVRTLHHYEQIGLVVPERSSSGYRQYTVGHIDRLTTILYYRELGFGLPDIAALIDDAQVDSAEHLRRHRELVQQRLGRLTDLLAAIDRELEAHTMGTELTPEEKLEIFGEGYDPAWESGAEQRWGDTQAWKVSQQRSKKLTKDEWIKVKADGDALMARFAEAKNRGVSPDSDEAVALAEEHRRSVETFYPCSYAQHRGLAQLFVTDERFAKTYDDAAPGLSQWVHDAIQANADRHGAPAHSADAWK